MSTRRRRRARRTVYRSLFNPTGKRRRRRASRCFSRTMLATNLQLTLLSHWESPLRLSRPRGVRSRLPKETSSRSACLRFSPNHLCPRALRTLPRTTSPVMARGTLWIVQLRTQKTKATPLAATTLVRTHFPSARDLQATRIRARRTSLGRPPLPRWLRNGVLVRRCPAMVMRATMATLSIS